MTEKEREYAVLSMRQAWHDLGKPAREDFKRILAGTKTIHQVNKRWQPRIALFTRNLEEFNGKENVKESFEEIFQAATLLTASIKAHSEIN
ncbi:MAG TPA: hypothetical protein VGB77_12555 [Abditibacteriaceae bacterium]|jgi:hypothetical protein